MSFTVNTEIWWLRFKLDLTIHFKIGELKKNKSVFAFRFLFILLGPLGRGPQYHEIGRSIATLMTDEVRIP